MARRTCGGRGRPLYVDPSEAAYAPASAIATRSPRRRGGRSCVPSESVDSQIGPSTRTGDKVSGPDVGSTGRPADVNATIGWRAPYSAGRMSSVIPASRITWRPARSRTWRTRATSHPARATSARPGSMASRVGRRSSGTASSNGPSSRAKRSGLGDGSSVGRTGKPPPRSTVSNVSIEPRQRAASDSALRTASRHASTAPSCDPTWRWRPRERSGPSGPPPASIAVAISVSVMPNFVAPAPTARPVSVSGATSGLSRYRTSMRGACARVAATASASASSGDSRAIQRSGSPSLAARAAARRSAGVLPIPSSVIRSFGTPARRASAHSPRDTTFAPKPRSVTAAITAGTSFALTEYWRTIGSGNAAVVSAHAAARVARSVTKTGVPKRAAARRSVAACRGLSVSPGPPCPPAPRRSRWRYHRSPRRRSHRSTGLAESRRP